ncbi:AraC family transcriptional regulator [Solimonas sp. K1W22B-7]|uniref:AraC family transcriptional regulator n=1 Tax=Solimonas sp. K1W22B-7 TaxID=2303331 RepID=UPI000E334F36|nr:AraC family transcriptional regulator [Solimonas sp. K1W22B-7]AXQ30508.1 AraC family transcriptional regulator [Solimonas sp. K1W22B-7]
MAGNYFPGEVLLPIADLIRSLGSDPAVVAGIAGLSPKAFDHPDIPIPGATTYRLLEQAAGTCRCRDFGMRLASRSTLAILGPLWVLLRNAGTVRQFMEDLAANYDFYTRAAIVTMEPAGDGLLLCWDAVAGVEESTVQAVEFVFALGSNEFRAHAPSSWNPPGVMFRHAAPPDLSAHHRVFGPNVRFNQDRNAVYADRATLALLLNTGGSHTRAVMRSVLRLEHEVQDPGITTRVEGIVRALLPFASCTVDDVSRAMGMTTRTLQDHLLKQDQSFKGIKDQVRADLALRYLRSSTLAIAEIAEILGYSEVSAFSRSFRRWHGVSAQSVRQAGRISAS